MNVIFMDKEKIVLSKIFSMQDVQDLNTELTGYFSALADNINIRCAVLLLFTMYQGNGQV